MPINPVVIKAATTLVPSQGLGGPAPGNGAAPGNGFDTVLKATIDQKPAPVGPANQIGPVNPIDSAKPSPVQHVIASMTHSENRLRDLVNKSLSGTSMPPEKLLALQASVYQATLEIDVVSKGVEQTTSGFKTLLQSQI